jgi:hypothetical protein
MGPFNFSLSATMLDTFNLSRPTKFGTLESESGLVNMGWETAGRMRWPKRTDPNTPPVSEALNYRWREKFLKRQRSVVLKVAQGVRREEAAFGARRADRLSTDLRDRRKPIQGGYISPETVRGWGPTQDDLSRRDRPGGLAALEDFSQRPWGQKYPPIAAMWRRHWDQVIPFFPTRRSQKG